MLDIHTGQAKGDELRQVHHGSVTCCVYNDVCDELITGGEDGQIVLWSVPSVD